MSYTLPDFQHALMQVVNAHNQTQYAKDLRECQAGIRKWDPYKPDVWTDDDDQDFWRDVESILCCNDASLTVPDFGVVTLHEQWGGEGQGDDYWIVLKIVEDDGTVRYVKRDGYHASHDGSYLDGPSLFVEMKTKVVTVFE